MSRLSDRLNEAKPGVSIVAGVERARRAGHAIDRGTVYRYLKGDHAKNPSDETLAALGAVFGLRVTELRRLADKPTGELEPYEPPAYANRLNRDQRKALDNLIRTIVEGAPLAEVVDISKGRPNPAAAAKTGAIEPPDPFD